MNQSRLGSFIEAWANIFVGFGVAMATNAVVLPVFGFHISSAQNFWIACVFTVISLIRSYVLRRMFNKLRLFYYESEERFEGVQSADKRSTKESLEEA